MRRGSTGVLLAVSCLLALPSGAAEQATVRTAADISIGDFFKADVFRNAALSPDGKLVADINYPDEDHQYVTLIDLANDTSTDIVTAADKSETFTDLRWVSNDTLVFFDHIGKRDTKLAAVRWEHPEGGKPRLHLMVWPGSYWVVDPLISQGSVVLLGHDEGSGDDERVNIYKADINAGPDALKPGQRVQSLDGSTSWIMTDQAGDVRVIVTRDKDGVRHLKRYSAKPVGGSNWVEFKTLDDDKVIFTPEMMAPDGHDLYVFSNLGRNTTGLFEYDPDKDSFVKTLFATDEGDVTNWHFDSATYRLIYAIWYAGTEPRYAILDERAQTYVPSLQQAFPGMQIVPWGVAAGGKRILVYVYNDINDGEYYAFDADKRNAQLLGTERPWLDPVLMSPTTAGSLTTKDGFTVNYLLTLPKTGKAPFPLVVIPHGGPIGVFNVQSFDNETQLLASRGFAVLKVNYRGSGGSGKTFEQAGNRQWGRKIEDDIEEAVDTVLRKAPIDPSRICLFGASYGGYSALMGVIRDPQRYKCAASYAGVTDLPLLYDTTIVQFDKRVRDDMAEIIGDPTTDAAQLRSISPVYLADKVTRPILLAQGGEDYRVDKEQAYRMKMVLEQLKKPVEFQFYPKEGHGFFEKEDEVDFYTRLLDFLGRNIGGLKPTAAPAPTTH